MCNVENIDSDNYMQIVNDDYNQHLNKIKQLKTDIEYIQNRFSSFQRYLIKQNACDFAITDELSLISSEYTNCFTRYQTYIDNCLSNYYNLLNYELKKREIHKQTQKLVKVTKLENIRLKKRINAIKRQYINNSTELSSVALKKETIDMNETNTNTRCSKKSQNQSVPSTTKKTPSTRLSSSSSSSSPLPPLHTRTSTTTTTINNEQQIDQSKSLTDNIRLIKCSNGLQYTYIDTCELSVALRQFIENNQLTQTYVAETLFSVQGKRLQALINTPPTWIKCHEETRRLLTRIKLFLCNPDQIDTFLKYAKKQQEVMKLNKNHHLETIDYSRELLKYDLNSYQEQKTTKELANEIKNLLAKNSIKLDLFCNYGFDKEILSSRRLSHLLSCPLNWHKLNDMSKYYMIKISDWLKDPTESLNKLNKLRNSLSQDESVIKAQLEDKEKLNEQRLYESQLIQQQQSNDTNHQIVLNSCISSTDTNISKGSCNFDESQNLPYPYDITKLDNIQDLIQPHEIASKLKEVLERECITKAEFARSITKSAQSTLFELINKPKSWSLHSKLACDRYKAMYMWLKDEDRLSKIGSHLNDDSTSRTSTNVESIQKTMFHEIVDKVGNKSLTTGVGKANLQYLINIFNMNQYPTENEIEKMSHYLNIDQTKIRNWFRKRRFSQKNKIKKMNLQNSNTNKTYKKNAISESSEAISEEQLIELTKLFTTKRYPDAVTVQNLSKKLNLSIITINKWFSMTRQDDNEDNLNSFDYNQNNNEDADSDGDNDNGDDDDDGDDDDGYDDDELNENQHYGMTMFDPQTVNAQFDESTKFRNISTDTNNNNNIQIEIDKIKVEMVEYHVSE